MSAPIRRPVVGTKASVRLKKGERRRQLLACARELFATLGYAETTWEKVAETVGVSQSILARHFPDRLALLQGVVDELRAQTLQKWQQEHATLTDPLVRLHALAEAYLAATRDHSASFRAMHRVLVEEPDADALSVLRGYYLDAETMLAAVIAEGQQSGVFRRSLGPRVGAWQLIRTALGYTMTKPLTVPLDAETDSVARAIDCLLHCLVKTDV